MSRRSSIKSGTCVSGRRFLRITELRSYGITELPNYGITELRLSYPEPRPRASKSMARHSSLLQKHLARCVAA